MFYVVGTRKSSKCAQNEFLTNQTDFEFRMSQYVSEITLQLIELLASCNWLILTRVKSGQMGSFRASFLIKYTILVQVINVFFYLFRNIHRKRTSCIPTISKHQSLINRSGQKGHKRSSKVKSRSIKSEYVNTSVQQSFSI